MKTIFLTVLFIYWTAQAQAANSEPSTEANIPLPTSEGIAVATPSAPPEIYLVPIGLIERDITSNTWGSMFGLIGALLEQSATGEGNARTAQSLSPTLEKSVAPRLLFA